MIIDVSKIVNSPGASMDISLEESMEALDIQTRKLLFVEPVKVLGVVSVIDPSTLTFKGQVETVYQLPCDRCARAVEKDIKVELFETFTKDSFDDSETELRHFKGNTIDLKPIVVQGILLQLPMKILCDLNCKGICSQCGQNLNEGNCSCEGTDINPHFAVLKSLFKEK